MWDPRRICDLHHSSWQRQILPPLSEARDPTHILMDISGVLNPLSHKGTPNFFFNMATFMGFFGVLFFFCLFAISWAAPAAYGGSQARGLIGAAAASLRQSHSNTGSKPHLQPTPQLTATLDP